LSNKPTILVVDDESLNLEVLSEILKDKFSVKVAISGLIALKVLEKFKIDLVLLDIKMPDMNGYEVAKKMADDENLKDIPIIFLTAYTNENSITQAFEIGGKDYISKPFNKSELFARIDNQLRISILEKELKTLNLKLEKRVQEEVSKVVTLQKENFQNQKKAAMGDLIGIIAHQLKQPLNMISIISEKVIMDYEFNELERKSIEDFEKKLHEELKFMSNSIDELRNFFRPDKHTEDILLKDTIDKSLSIIANGITQKGIKIIKEFDNDIKINSISSELQQVYINILTNAKDAIMENNIQDAFIKIFTEEKVIDNKKLAFIIIEDNGGGIEDDIIDKVFNSNFTTKGQKGTGIGLHLSKMIIQDSLHGEITVSNTNSGAKFQIILDSV
jgi:two-component system sensor histidine kinase/response regulator